MLPLPQLRVLKVKAAGDRFYRELRIPTPCRHDKLMSQIATKLRLGVSDIARLTRLPDMAVVDDEGVQALEERAEVVVQLMTPS
mmetsp:Transcript_31195/g.70524  ORF Transcript_31195/g.70524 Transcript_31195/m.70524 type:complete len:84 (+) Transcript_31195:280-531(+)